MPATGTPIWAPVPVPPVTLFCRMRVTSYATPSLNARVRSGANTSSVPSGLTILEIARGCTRKPPFESGAYAVAMSSGVTSPAPRPIEATSGSLRSFETPMS